MTGEQRTTRRSLVAAVPGMRSNAPKRNTIVLLLYLVLLVMVLTGVGIIGMLDVPGLAGV